MEEMTHFANEHHYCPTTGRVGFLTAPARSEKKTLSPVEAASV